MKKKILNTLLLATAISLTACGDNRPPEEIVKERALARWDIRIAGKIDGLYEYLSPSQKQITTRPNYERQFGNAVAYTKATIKSVKCSGIDKKKIDACKVTIYINVENIKAGFPPAGATLTETWVKEDKQWWITP